MRNHLSNLSSLELTQLLAQWSRDFRSLAQGNEIPDQIQYKVASVKSQEDVQLSRFAALKQTKHSLIKQAFDTRRIDSEQQRNPRENLQNYVRQDPFISKSAQEKITIFSKMLKPLEELKQSYGQHPEWHSSYVRKLRDDAQRILRIKEADGDFGEPQLNYLEQLLYNRYRLTLADLEKLGSKELKSKLMAKDEDLLNKGVYTPELLEHTPKATSMQVSPATQQSIIEAIFGNQNLRQNGEKGVERTITITIKDQVIDD